MPSPSSPSIAALRAWLTAQAQEHGNWLTPEQVEAALQDVLVFQQYGRTVAAAKLGPEDLPFSPLFPAPSRDKP
ncbi:MAG TPA: hypothetical protein VL359_13780 [bacterium]|nr:hypothetical protein [bacterium]